jgi:hypothetical protein
MRLLGLIGAALLAGCAAKGPAGTSGTPGGSVPPPAPAAVAEAAALEHFASQQRALARSAARNNDDAAAAQAWARVLALAPADAEARAGHAGATAAVAAAAREQQRSAEQARLRGDSEAAQRGHLKALSLDPTLADSTAALRRLEAARAPRTGFASPPAPSRSAGLPDEAAWLLSIGDQAGALRLLEPLAAGRQGAALRPRVCELLLAQARELQASDPAAAQAAAARCLKLLPQHAGAREWQRGVSPPR